jgi:uncharacterized delta-60 repeat protein
MMQSLLKYLGIMFFVRRKILRWLTLNLVAIASTILTAAPVDQTYRYDGLGRLTDAAGSLYTLDAASNLTQITTPATAALVATPNALSLPVAGGSATVALASSVTWTTSSSQTWLTVSPSSGSGSTTLTLTATSNLATTSRTALVTLTGGGQTATITATQSGTTILEVPTNIAATDGTYTDKVRVSWAAAAGAETYVVSRNSTNSVTGATSFPATDATSYDDTTAIRGTIYYYFVRASSSAAGFSGLSAGNSGYADPGQSINNASLDPTFGNAGKVITGFPGTNEWANAVAIQNDGKIVITGMIGSGSNWDGFIARYNADGTLDSTFGAGGKVVVDYLGRYDSLASLVIQNDGKIVAVGYTGTAGTGANPMFLVVRVNSDGSFDSTFGSGGKVTTSRVGLETAASAALQSDGKIIVGGSSGITSNGFDTGSDFMVVRYNTNGTLDTSFSGDGIATADFGNSEEYFSTVIVDPQGRILACGSTYHNGSPYRIDPCMARFTADGALDTTFGTAGLLQSDRNQSVDVANAFQLLSDGRVIAGGYTESGSPYGIQLSRYTSSNVLDTSFGAGGWHGWSILGYPSISQGVSGMSVQSDGTIMVTGTQAIMSGAGGQKVFLGRFLPDGANDPSFASGGLVSANFGSTYATSNAMVIQSDGRIIIVGSANNATDGTNDILLARFGTPVISTIPDFSGPNDGTPDTTLGISGLITTSFHPVDGAGSHASLQQPDGKVILVGSAVLGGQSYIALARYNADGTLDSTFGTGGLVANELGDAKAAALQTDGKIVVAAANKVARYMPNGLLDASFGTNGFATITGMTASNSSCLAIQSDGKLVICGYASNGTNNDFAVARLNTDGSMDSSFDGDGVVTTATGNLNEVAQSVALQPDGKIVVCGNSWGYNTQGANESSFAVVRYLPNGALDTTFDSGGIAKTTFGDFTYATPNHLVIQKDGKIVVTGPMSPGGVSGLAAARYLPNGALDPTFDGDGKLMLTGQGGLGAVLAIQNDGKILVGGPAGTVALSTPFNIARLTSSGALDTTFDGDGIASITFGASQGELTSLLVQPDDRVIAAGSTLANNRYAFAMQRLGHALAPELAMTFDGVEIPAGDITPTAAKGTVFSPVGTGSGITRTFTLRNLGSAALTIQSMGVTSGAFRLAQSFTGTLAAGGSGSFAVAYEPATGGPHTATVTITSTDTDEGTSTFLISGATSSGADDFGDTPATATTIAPVQDGIQGTLNTGTDQDWFCLTVTSRGTLQAWTTGSTDTLGAFFDSSGTMLGTENDNADGLNFFVSASVTPGTYYLRVRSQGATGLYTPTTSFTPAAIEAPVSLSASDGSFASKIQLTWNAVQGAERYYARRSLNPTPIGGTDFPFVTSNQYDDTSASLDKLYYYWVRSWSAAAGYSAFSPMDVGMVAFPAFGEGSFDLGFGGAGRVLTSINGADSYGQAVAIQSDGKIVVAGYATVGSNRDFAVVRYLADGTMDTTFGNSGVLTTDFAGAGDQAYCLAIQPDGRIVVAGYAVVNGAASFAIARYLPTGALDTSFNNTGKATALVGTDNDGAYGVALLPGGKVVVVGFSIVGSDQQCGIICWNSDGSLDTSFNGNGKLRLPFGTGSAYGKAVIAESDGRIILLTGTSNELTLARLNPDGTLDTTFHGDGRISIGFGSGGVSPGGIALQSDGKLVVSGYSVTLPFQLVAARLNPDGSLDTNFGTNGKQATNFASQGASGGYVQIQPNGKIVLAGSPLSYPGGLAAARLNTDGSLDESFGSHGISAKVFATQTTAFGVALTSDSKIIVVGQSQNGSIQNIALGRFEVAALPEIDILDAGTLPASNLVSGIGAINLGSVDTGTSTTRIFSIHNSGNAPLTGLVVTKGDPNSNGVTLTQPATTWLNAGGATTFGVEFLISQPGINTVTIHIGSNDADENPFHIILTGTGYTASESWRRRHFGITTNTGSAADTASPQGDGITNLMKFATAMNPTLPGTIPGILSMNGNQVVFSYTRNKAALADGITFAVEWTDALNGAWSTAGVYETVFDQSATEMVMATIPAGSISQRFIHLRVTRP